MYTIIEHRGRWYIKSSTGNLIGPYGNYRIAELSLEVLAAEAA